MPEQKITKETLISAGMVMALCGSIFWLGMMTNRVTQNEKSIEEIKIQCGNNPTRIEFDALIKKVDEISTDVKTLISHQ